MNRQSKRHIAGRKVLPAIFFVLISSALLFSCKGKASDFGGESASQVQEQTEQAAENQASVSRSSWEGKLEQLSVAYYPDGLELQTGGFASSPDPSGASSESFELAQYGPTGLLPSEIRQPTVWILFSQPVIPLSRLGEEVAASSLVQIEPEVSGSFRWYGSRLLVFQADEQLLPQREYRVQVNDLARSLSGNELRGKRSFTFRSEELEMRRFLPGAGKLSSYREEGGVPLEDAASLLIEFNYPVDPELVQSYLRLESAGQSFQVKAYRPEAELRDLSSEEATRMLVAESSVLLPEDSDVDLVLMAGAKSKASYIGREEAQRFSFHTIRPFDFVRQSRWSYRFPGSAGDVYPLFLEFSHPLDPESLAGALHFTPELEISSENISVQDHVLRLSGLDFAYSQKYQLEIGEGVRDIYGRSLEKARKITVSIPEAASFYNFPRGGARMLEAEFAPKIVFDYQNVDDGVWKIGAVEDPYTFWEASALAPYPFPDLPENTRHFESLDLSPWLGNDGYGWLGVSWNFSPVQERTGKRSPWRQRDLTIQVTDLGLTLRYGYNRVVAWVSRLSDGSPVEGARVSLLSGRERKFEDTSDDQGLASFHLDDGVFNTFFKDPDSDWRDRLRVQVEFQGDKIEFMPNSSHNHWRSGPLSTSSPTRVQEEQGETFLFTDRGIYRPGETLSFRGIDRRLRLGEYSPYEGRYRIAVQEHRWRGEELSSFEGRTSESGGFYGSYTLPEDIKPGYYRLAYSRPGGKEQLRFQVAEFERLNFQLDLSFPDRIYYLGDTVPASLSASYLSGGGLGDAAYDYSWTKEPAWFSPPGNQWEAYRFALSDYDRRYFLSEGSGILGPDGGARYSQKSTPEGIEGMPYRYRSEVRVADAGGQQIADRDSVIVHPAAFYIGLKMERDGWSWFVQKGETVSVDWALVDPAGTLYAQERRGIEATLYKRSWKLAQQQGVAGRINTRYEMELEEVDRRSIAAGSSDSGSVQFTPESAGSYLIRFRGEDSEGRIAKSEFSFYATGSDMVRWGYSDSDMIGLESDSPSYKPGDTASILIKSPLPEGDYLVCVEREGIFDEKLVHLNGSANVIGIPITEEHVPVVYVTVSSYSVRSGKPDNDYLEPDLDKPKGYFGLIPLRVDTGSRSFDIEIESNKAAYRPGEEAEVELYASKDGKALANAEISFMAVDRGVLDLIDYHVPDPVAFFYDPRKFPLGTRGADSRSLLLDPVTYEVNDLRGGDGEGKIEEREDFRPLAVFEPFVKTDEEGKAVVRFTLPDSLTAYRCTAIGVKDNLFAKSEEEITARNPVNVRAALPEQLRLRDTVEGGVSVSNLSRSELEIEVSAESELLTLEGDVRQKVSVGAGDTRFVPFLFSASESGEGQIVFHIESELLKERLVRRVKVEKPAVYETVSSGKRLDLRELDEASDPVEMIRLPGQREGALELSLSSSKAALFEDAVQYLINYPFDCYEQQTSKLIPYILFGETGIFPGIEELSLPGKRIEEGLKELSDAQLSSGGFPYWEGSRRASFYVSCRVAQLVQLCKGAGYSLPGEMDERALLEYLRKPEQEISEHSYLSALGLYARSLLGDDVRSDALKLAKREDELGIAGYSLNGLALIRSGAPVEAEKMLRRIEQFIRPSSRTLDISETWESGASWYGSEVERISLVLMLLQRLEPDNILRDKALESLIQRRRSARWGNTVENSWALIAVAGELGLKLPPDIRADVRLGEHLLTQASFDSLADPPVHTVLPLTTGPLSEASREEPLPVRFDTRGEGELSYRLSMRYTVPAEAAPARDMGIGVMQDYFDLQGRRVDPDRLKAGETYRVRVYVSSPMRRDFLALRVPIPSGTVILDPGLVSAARYEGYEERIEEEERDEAALRPNRSEVHLDEMRYFFDRFPQGRGEAEFLIRAVRPGVYPLPPASAECMYEPEVFGRDSGRLVYIEQASLEE